MVEAAGEDDVALEVASAAVASSDEDLKRMAGPRPDARSIGNIHRHRLGLWAQILRHARVVTPTAAVMAASPARRSSVTPVSYTHLRAHET